MKIIFALLLLIGCAQAQLLVMGRSPGIGPGCTNTSYGRFTCVAHAGGFTSSNTVRAQTIAVTSGDEVTFVGAVLTTGLTLTLADSGACTGTLTGAGTNISMTNSVAIGAVTKATSTGTCTITMTAGASTTLVSSIQNWTGSTGVVDVSAAITSNSGAGSRSCPAVTTTVDSDLVLCMMTEDGNNGGVYTPGTGFQITLGNNSLSQEAQVQTTHGAITPQFTYSAGTLFGVITFALE